MTGKGYRGPPKAKECPGSVGADRGLSNQTYRSKITLKETADQSINRKWIGVHHELR